MTKKEIESIKELVLYTEELQAQNDKLRAALERIINEGIDTSTDGGMEIVREALAETENK